MSPVVVQARPLWLAATNCFVVAPERGGPGVVVDAPPDPVGIGALLASLDVTPVALLLTHGHVDHMGGAGTVAASHQLTTYVHPDDDYLTLHPEDQLRMLFGMIPPGDYAPPEHRTDLTGGEVIDEAGLGFEVLHTPGHTPGHCCFLLRHEGILFSGDQLFAGSIGRTDLPGGSLEQLATSMREQVMVLPDDTRVLTGHGPETTIGRERVSNPFRDLWEG